MTQTLISILLFFPTLTSFAQFLEKPRFEFLKNESGLFLESKGYAKNKTILLNNEEIRIDELKEINLKIESTRVTLSQNNQEYLLWNILSAYAEFTKLERERLGIDLNWCLKLLNEIERKCLTPNAQKNSLLATLNLLQSLKYELGSENPELKKTFFSILPQFEFEGAGAYFYDHLPSTLGL